MRRSPLSIMGQRVCSRPAPAAPPERGTTTPTSPRGGGAPVRVSFPLAPPSPAAAARRPLIGGSAAGPRHRRWRPSGRWGSGGRRHFVCLERGSGQRRPPRRGRGAPGERPGSGGGPSRQRGAARPGLRVRGSGARGSPPALRWLAAPLPPAPAPPVSARAARGALARPGAAPAARPRVRGLLRGRCAGGRPGRALPPGPPRGPGAAPAAPPLRPLPPGRAVWYFLPKPPFRQYFRAARAGLVVPTGLKRGRTAPVYIKSEIGVRKHVSWEGREPLVVAAPSTTYKKKPTRGI